MPLPNTLCESLQQAIIQAKLPPEFMAQIESIYVPLAEHIDQLARQQSSPFVLSLQAPQGTGKSTLCSFLQLLLEQHYDQRLAVLSLDDFYYDSVTREQLAKDIHPLLKTRGVPGTHDRQLALDTLHSLKSGNSTSLPRFNKADDNPYPRSEWPDSPDNVTIILFEGWCNNVPPQSQAQLLEPINELEALEDPHCQWRTYVNQQAALHHDELFALTDALLCMQIPTFDLVYQWRGLQEEKLRATSRDASKLMGKQQLVRFIQHFERLSRHAMSVLPERADLLVTLDESHQLTQLKIRAGD